MTLIRALPAEYSSFVSSLLLLDTIDVEKLRAAFHNEDAQRKAQEERANIASRSALAAALAAKVTTFPTTTQATHPAASFPSSRTDTSTTQSKQCDWCGRSGHLEDECFTKKNARKRAQEKRRGKRGNTA
ncbi:hypothetical protein C8R42DRAFT_536079, partial [Lentinula raphanica]